VIQNSLDRLLAGMAAALRDTVTPAVEDPFARSQLAACVELLHNLATRVEWRRDQLDEVAAAALAATRAAAALAPGLEHDLGPEPSDDADPVRRRDEALARVSLALRWTDDHGGRDDAREPLESFARWHLGVELARLRTGMFSS
jgi:hypothetical protein